LVSKVLKKYYSEVTCYKVRDMNTLSSKNSFLTLLKTRKNNFHYIVVIRIKKGHVYYYDPAFIGIKKVGIAHFKKKWSHFCCFYN